jgi:hypothetical protein
MKGWSDRWLVLDKTRCEELLVVIKLPYLKSTMLCSKLSKGMGHNYYGEPAWPNDILYIFPVVILGILQLIFGLAVSYSFPNYWFIYSFRYSIRNSSWMVLLPCFPNLTCSSKQIIRCSINGCCSSRFINCSFYWKC